MFKSPNKELATVKVYPTKSSSMHLPGDGSRPKMTAEGVLWPRDGFTARRIADGSVTTTPPAKTAASSTASTAPAPAASSTASK